MEARILAGPRPLPLFERWVTAASLYWLTVASSVVGIVVPALTIAMKTVPEGSWLTEYSWHLYKTGPLRQHNIGFYYRYALANAVILLLVVVFRGRYRAALGALVGWFRQHGFRWQRRVILVALVGVVVCWQTKLKPGFWFYGIAGWTYADCASGMTQDPPSPAPAPAPAVLAALERGIVPDNAKYLPNAGFLHGRVLLLHFKNGEVFPANWELLDMVFPYVVLHPVKEADARTFFDIAKANLDRRRQGRRMLLPVAWAYPNHGTYVHVSYADCPPADQLAEVSSWAIAVAVGEDRRVSIIRAYKEWAAHAP